MSDLAESSFSQNFEADRITLSIAFETTSDKKQAIKTSDKRIYEIQKEMVVEYLTDKVSAKTAEIADLLNVSPQRARAVLSKMIAGLEPTRSCPH